MDFEDVSLKRTKQNRYEYEQQLEPCHCTTCNGALQPRYTIRKHARLQDGLDDEEDDVGVARGEGPSALDQLKSRIKSKTKTKKRKGGSRTAAADKSESGPIISAQPLVLPHVPAISEAALEHALIEDVSRLDLVDSNEPAPAHTELTASDPASPDVVADRELLASDSGDITYSLPPQQPLDTRSIVDSSPPQPPSALPTATCEPLPAIEDDNASTRLQASVEQLELAFVHDDRINSPVFRAQSREISPDGNVQEFVSNTDNSVPREPTDEPQAPEDQVSLSESHVVAASPLPSGLIYNAPPDVHDVLTESSSTWFWRIVMLMGCWIHLRHFVSHRAVDLVLHILRLIFVQLGVLVAGADSPVTLQTSMRRLRLDDQLRIRPMCPSCRRTYPATTPFTACCSHCGAALFFPRGVTNVPTAAALSRSTQKPPRPQLQSPYILPSQLLANIINSTPKMEDELDKWRSRQCRVGKLDSIQDGRIWKTLPGPDNNERAFFDNAGDRPDAAELRIGVTLGFDGFGFTRSAFAGKHSTGALGLSIANLDHNLRYRPENVLLCGLTPGPKELNTEELQWFMKEFVDDLLTLYDHGMLVKTGSCPEGRRVRVILVAVCCDHPALCRMCGFGDHGTKKMFCTRCHIPLSDLRTANGVTIDAYEARDGEEHSRKAQEYGKLETDQSREAFFQEHATRYFELSRLPYFDPVKMSVIDPMHNILLGVVKTQWFDAWIQTKALRQETSTNKVQRELDDIHEYLKVFEMPDWVARLPNEVGYPAGGSLTSDEWKAMAMVYCPIVIPLIWEDWAPAAEDEYQRKLAKWNENEKKRLRRIARGKRKSDGSVEEPAPKPAQPRMLSRDADNFLCLASALKIILARSIDVAELPRAQKLLQSYLDGFLELHPDQVKPNFHYITHIFDQILDYGPVYGFWTFLFERLNKMLKSYAVNNHGGGELETTFFREYHREIRLRSMVAVLSATEVNDETSSEDKVTIECLRLISQSNTDSRGTVAALIQEVDDLSTELMTSFSLSPGVQRDLPQDLQSRLVEHYSMRHPEAHITSRSTANRVTHSTNFLNGVGIFHDWAIVQGRRIKPSTFNGRASNSLIQVYVDGCWYVGEVAAIVSHFQPFSPDLASKTLREHLLHVRWLKRLDHGIIDTSIWEPYPELEIFFWAHNEYLDSRLAGPPALITVTSVLSYAARISLSRWPGQQTATEYNDEDGSYLRREGIPQKVWGTVGLTRDAIVI